MSINFHIENQSEWLKVVASGEDDNLEEVLAYGSAIIQAAIEYSSKKILCDERKLQYTLSITDTFKLAEEASRYAKNVVRIAIVCDAQYLDDGRFFETVASNRGLIIRVTSSYEEASAWLEL
jgi:hypothetical protein